MPYHLVGKTLGERYTSGFRQHCSSISVCLVHGPEQEGVREAGGRKGRSDERRG